MDWVAFFQQVQQLMLKTTEVSDWQTYSPRGIFAAFDDARSNVDFRVANGSWHWAGDTLVRNCRVAFNHSHNYYSDLSAQQLDQLNSDHIHQLWKWADSTALLPQHVIVLLGTTEIILDNDIQAVHAAHQQCLAQLKQQNKIKNYTLIASINNSVHMVEWLHEQPHTLVIPWFMFRYHRIYPHAFHSVPGDRILFTPGRVITGVHQGRMDRIATLAHLAGLSDRSQWLWSYTGTQYDVEPAQHAVDLIRTVINTHAPQLKITDNPMSCLDVLQQSMDTPTAQTWAERGSHQDTYPIPTSVYAQTAVEFVHETWYYERIHLTEKIFRPILLGIPWVTVNPAHSVHLQAVTPLKCYLDLIDVDPHTCQPNPMGNQEKLNYSAGLPHAYKLHSIAHSDAVQQRADYNRNTAKHMVRQFIRQLTDAHPGVDLDLLAQTASNSTLNQVQPAAIPSAP